ncbi:hypothetical protein SALCHL_003710 [Streptomyces albus subsp. chlorinus]|uniref:hypothetical protein n=1 Tax=Streptomyces albus TaxID=1888 RepID=UPI0015711CE8|nr:hypothetical protein [Streptomyces albus]
MPGFSDFYFAKSLLNAPELRFLALLNSATGNNLGSHPANLAPFTRCRTLFVGVVG